MGRLSRPISFGRLLRLSPIGFQTATLLMLDMEKNGPIIRSKVSLHSNVPYAIDRSSNLGFMCLECLRFHIRNSQCRHVLLACGYDAGYTPFLGEFAADKRLANRITLVQGGLHGFKANSDFRTVGFEDVFVHVQGRRSANPSNGTQSIQSVPRIGTPLWVYQNATLERFGQIQVNQENMRIDRPLSVSPEVLDRLAKQKMCYWFYLRGTCDERDCKKGHEQRILNEEEWDALWLLARRGPCFKASRSLTRNCGDRMCIYRHG